MVDITSNPTPGELVKSFSWQMENRESSDAESEVYTQLRRDFIEYNKVSNDETEAEMSRLESYFSETR